MNYPINKFQTYSRSTFSPHKDFIQSSTTSSFYKSLFPLKNRPYNSLSQHNNKNVKKDTCYRFSLWHEDRDNQMEKINNEQTTQQDNVLIFRFRRPVLGSHVSPRCFSPGPGWAIHCPQSSCCNSSVVLP